jgi:hypothetical protein
MAEQYYKTLVKDRKKNLMLITLIPADLLGRSAFSA